MARRKRHSYGDAGDFAEYGDYGDPDMGLDQIFSPENLKAGAVATLAGGGGILAMSALSQKVLPDSWPVWGKGLISLGVGAVGGFVLNTWSREAGCGFMGGVAGLGLASIVGNLLGMGTSLGQAPEEEELSQYDEEVTLPPGEEYAGLMETTSVTSRQVGMPDLAGWGLGQAAVEEEAVLGGMLG